MNCKNARQAVVLDHYGELDEKDRIDLEAHLRGCAACAADREETRRVLALVSTQGSAAVPRLDSEHSWRLVRAGIRDAARRRPAFAPGLRWGLAGAGLTLVLIAGILIGRFGLKNGPAPSPVSAKSAVSAVPSGSASVLSAASLQPVLATHLEDLRPVLLDFANSVGNGKPGAVVSVDERLLRGLMLQNLLAERFHLSVHHEARTLHSSALMVGKGGPKLKAVGESASAGPSADGTPPARNLATDPPWTVSQVGDRCFRLTAKRMELKALAGFLESVLQTPVEDETGLIGLYEFTLDFLPPGYPSAGESDVSRGDEDCATDIYSALQRQLGLKLNAAQKLSRDMLVVDHVDEAPTAN
ncbi:MAG: TIGR03435 family protein [Candidatus Aminicenantales bacterium]